jgi:lipooligosaccharide transport system ATP-binding protein
MSNLSIPVEAINISKRFGNFFALRQLSLSVESGQCVGLLGPNGAGKSTFIGCLYGLVVRSGGDLRVFGLDPANDVRRIKRRIGVVPQENALDEDLTVLENMNVYAQFFGVKHPRKRIEELLGQMSLDRKRDAPIRTLSGGMKRRLTFVRALLSDPDLLILDEPTTGLDPAVRHILWENVLSYRWAGKAILVTTHYMHEAERLCDRVVILNKGVVIDGGTPKWLVKNETPGFVAIFEPFQKDKVGPYVDSAWHCFIQANQYCVRAPRLEDLTALQNSSGAVAIQTRPANLEDVFLKLTGEELGENE